MSGTDKKSKKKNKVNSGIENSEEPSSHSSNIESHKNGKRKRDSDDIEDMTIPKILASSNNSREFKKLKKNMIDIDLSLLNSDKDKTELLNSEVSENKDEQLKKKKKKKKKDKADTDLLPKDSEKNENESLNCEISENKDNKLKKKKKKKKDKKREDSPRCLVANGKEMNHGDDITSNNDEAVTAITTESTPLNSRPRYSMDSSFASLRGQIAASTMAAVEKLGFSTMTEIQARAIPPLLEGEDLRGIAKTGSGKTLAFLIPAVELLHRQKFEPCYGTGVLIVSPTRELCMQTHSVATQLLQDTPLSCGLITGGRDMNADKTMLRKGANVLVATPGRLLDHLRNTSHFKYSHLACLVLDEADKMLDNNFEEAMLEIMKALPKQRQTMLFSATKTANTNKLVAVALKEKFVDVDVSAQQDTVTADGLKQSYVVVPLEHKFLFLYRFLKKKLNKLKIMVFFSTCDAVKFYSHLLSCLMVENTSIHGKQKQGERTKAFRDFNAASSGALLCTDVAARGWDIPNVHWVVQYDAPVVPSEYVHRVGRTARGDREGQALVLLRQEELPFVRYLQKRKVDITELALTEKSIPKVQEQVENLVENCEYLSWWSKKAYVACIDAYTTHKRPDIFDYWNLDVGKLSKSFGLSKVPDVDFAVSFRNSNNKKNHLRLVKEGFYENEEEEADWQSIARPSRQPPQQ